MLIIHLFFVYLGCYITYKKNATIIHLLQITMSGEQTNLSQYLFYFYLSTTYYLLNKNDRYEYRVNF
jgi:hypothetical protein